jgi:hypothetical protein
MSRLDDAGMDRPDRNLMQAVTVHGQELIIRRIPARRGRSRPERPRSHYQAESARISHWP